MSNIGAKKRARELKAKLKAQELAERARKCQDFVLSRLPNATAYYVGHISSRAYMVLAEDGFGFYEAFGSTEDEAWMDLSDQLEEIESLERTAGLHK